ncbi:flavin reductase family protein [Fodinicola feengrottensis]|uniref:Flavin reductase family protein n=1 Tax=Fodinicola feengrottensis TaxID=435914 RepID=A0ABN2I9U2_9ACTN|nr:flavin reductase family protein [Fodinicola feengrottensis]
MTDDRTEIDVSTLPPGGTYPWLTATVIPRPIAWVSSLSADGVENLAPHSFFTVASAEPPVVSFTSVGEKDTIRNVRATGEFVVNFASRSLAEKINLTSTNFPPEHSEAAVAELALTDSTAVRPRRVAESPAALECRFVGEKSFGDSTVVFGQVLHLSVATASLLADGKPDAHHLDPAARLGRDEWGTLGEIFSLRRIPYREWAGSTKDGDPSAS